MTSIHDRIHKEGYDKGYDAGFKMGVAQVVYRHETSYEDGRAMGEMDAYTNAPRRITWLLVGVIVGALVYGMTTW